MNTSNTAKFMIGGALLAAMLACSVSVDTGAPTPLPGGIVTSAPEIGEPTEDESGGLDGNAAQPTNEVSLPDDAETASVNYIVDGDTIDVSLNGDDYRVRYVGMNTPERDDPCYQDAVDANAALVENQVVTLVRDVSDTDQYGRLLRYVYVGDVFVNAELVKGGWAEARHYRPDDSQYDYFDSLEANAADQGLGCWPTGVFER
jgi:endonuclease YncB( thermonuclease family)